MADIQWCIRNLVGSREVDGVVVHGEVLAFRDAGSEILFAPTPDIDEDVSVADAPRPKLAWVKTAEVSIHPFCLTYASDFVDDEDLPETPAARGPVITPAIKRRGGQ